MRKRSWWLALPLSVELKLNSSVRNVKGNLVFEGCDFEGISYHYILEIGEFVLEQISMNICFFCLVTFTKLPCFKEIDCFPSSFKFFPLFDL